MRRSPNRMSTYGRCLCCSATTLYGVRGDTICAACLREKESPRVKVYAGDAGRGRAVMEADAPRPVREIVTALLVLANMPALLWVAWLLHG